VELGDRNPQKHGHGQRKRDSHSKL
jgi:hypothetical protein